MSKANRQRALETQWTTCVGRKYGRLVETLVDRLRAFDDWLPANVNALPEGPRRYIHDLETRCDPAGDVQMMALQADTIRGLVAKVRDLEAELALSRRKTAAVLAKRRSLRGPGRS